jgi:hypothetical protein
MSFSLIKLLGSGMVWSKNTEGDIEMRNSDKSLFCIFIIQLNFTQSMSILRQL